jgi:hypothetical protein
MKTREKNYQPFTTAMKIHAIVTSHKPKPVVKEKAIPTKMRIIPMEMTGRELKKVRKQEKKVTRSKKATPAKIAKASGETKVIAWYSDFLNKSFNSRLQFHKALQAAKKEIRFNKIAMEWYMKKSHSYAETYLNNYMELSSQIGLINQELKQLVLKRTK